MKIDKSILDLGLTDFNKAIINNLGHEVWRKINNELDTSCVLFKGGADKYKELVYEYLVNIV